MEKTIREIGGRCCRIYSCGGDSAGAPAALLVQPVDDHDIEVLDSEAGHIERLAEGAPFTLAAFKVDDWNGELSPWEAPPVFGDAGFGSGAEETLRYITEELLPELGAASAAVTGTEETCAAGSGAEETCAAGTGAEERTAVYLGGYSLAGFFALWAAYRTDVFGGIAAASPSVWFPGWKEYAASGSVRAPRVYLSLGDKEEKTRNQVMRTVGDNIRSQLELLEGDPGCSGCILEMNQGNHFKEPDLRTAKGFAWLLKEDA